MPAEMMKRIRIILMLGLLTASAFFVRLENFKRTSARSIDEIVYYRMGKQVLQEGLSGYNTVPYGRELAATGRPLPQYFFESLFKHPPLFTFLITLSMKIFGINGSSAAYISLLLGAFMIPLTYYLGNIMFGEGIGLLSAIIMALDPITTICSQKVWPETSIGFFVTLSIYWFIRALKSDKNAFFLLSGTASSLGVLCKYPGGIATLIICLYALIFDRQLFKKTKFILGLLLPILSLMPWLIWNFWIYKINFLFLQSRLHSDKVHTILLIRNMLLFGLLAASSLILMKEIKKSHLKPDKIPFSNRHKYITYAIITILFLSIFGDAILKSLNPYHIPLTSWTGATFYNSPPTFYINRLLEFSSIYLLGFVAFFTKTALSNFSEKILKLTILTVLSFYTTWQAYQSRYILAALPPLIILGSRLVLDIYHRACSTHSFLIRITLKPAVIFIVVIMLIKLCIINMTVSFPNDMCYF